MLFLNTSLSLTSFKLNRYKQYINYYWSQTLTVGDTQQIKDTGTAGLNLQQFFGQGCWFNGVDNSISIESVPVSNNMSLAYNFVPAANSRIFGRSTWDTFIGFSTISATEGVVRCRFTGTDMVFTYKLTIGIPYSIVFLLKPTTIELFVNGILRESLAHTFTFMHPLEFIGRNSTAFANCIIKDTYIFNKHLSQIEIEKYTNQPNQFFMDSLVDNSCILAMPMCEKDGFVRNYKSYSEGSNLVVNGKFESDSNWNLGGWTVSNGVLVSSKVNGAKCTQAITLPINSIIEVSVDVLSFSGTSLRLYERDGGLGSLYLIGSFMTTTGSFKFLYRVQSSNFVLNIYDGDCNCTIDNVSVKQLTSIYPITNYLEICRTNAQRLSYGLQTSGFKRDTNWLILSKSNFLEADGVGYGNTGWIPKWNEDFTVESVFEVSNDSEFRLNGNNYADGIYFGKNSVGKSLYVRVFGAPVILLANSKDIVCLIFSYNWQTKEVKQYVDGVLVTTQLATKTTNSPLPVLLGMVALGGTNYPIIKPIRLLKVHNKVLTQEEITKNFNKFVTQGLLNE